MRAFSPGKNPGLSSNAPSGLKPGERPWVGARGFACGVSLTLQGKGRSTNLKTGIGNRLRHAYDRIDLQIVWNTVQHRLPSLKADARQALARLEAPEGG